MSDDNKTNMTEAQAAESAAPAEVLSEAQFAERMQEVNKKAEAEKEVLTEVTSVSAEEQKTGQETKITAEQMTQIAINDYMAGMLTIASEMPKLSNRGVRRLIIALLQLPHPDEPVKLVSQEEKRLFGIGQRVQVARMYLLMNGMKEDMRAKKELTDKENSETMDNKENENVEPTTEQNPA